MANYKMSMNKNKETKFTKTVPKCDSEKAIEVQIHQYIIIIIYNNSNNNNTSYPLKSLET
jgi:hypothetical protein